MTNYLSQSLAIEQVAEKLNISDEDFQLLSEEDKETLAQIIVVLAGVRRVPRDIE